VLAHVEVDVANRAEGPVVDAEVADVEHDGVRVAGVVVAHVRDHGDLVVHCGPH
jgi:hypothetical protein